MQAAGVRTVSAMRLVADALSRCVRYVVYPASHVFPRKLVPAAMGISSTCRKNALMVENTTPFTSDECLPPNMYTDIILRPPSPPSGKGRSRRSGTRRSSGRFPELGYVAAALATGLPRHASKPETPVLVHHLLRHRYGQLRHLSMPAVVSQPDALNWLKKEPPSIFEIFEKAVPTTRRTFRFVHAASAMPKRPQRKVPDDGVQYFSVQVGEDAYFVRSDSLGVADGVGGWAQVKGANPALYSRKLMHYASAELEKLDDIMESEYTIEDYNNADPRSILQKSYEKTNLDAVAENLLGSSTAIIAILRDDELRIANLGDCGVMVIRQDEAIFRTEEQQHSFNFPYQLGTGSRDTPNDAQIYKLKVEEGDIVILGSDGMFDNVFDEDIVDIVRSAVQSRKPTAIDPQRITDGLLKRAREIAEDGRLVSSPFQSRAIQEGLYYQGGKMDDVTVLVGVVRLSEDSPDRR